MKPRAGGGGAGAGAGASCPLELCQATVDVSAPSNLAAVAQLAAPAQHHPAPPFINKPCHL